MSWLCWMPAARASSLSAMRVQRPSMVRPPARCAARGHNESAEGWRCYGNVDHGSGLVLANLDALLTALYVRVDDLLPRRCGPGRPPRITDAELIALAVAQIFLAIRNDRQFLALARWRLGHLFSVPAPAARLRQAPARAGADDRPGHHAPGRR